MVMMTPAEAATPSFDCDAPRSQTERLICGDDALAALDMRLAWNFARALARASADEVIDLRTDQRAWRARLTKCGTEASPRACIVQAYQKRIRALTAGPEERNRPDR